MENLGSPQEKAARRPEINRVKELIKVANSVRQNEDPDRPVMDAGYKDVVRSFGLQGVETVDDLFNRTDAPNYNPGKAREALNVMATAVYETMKEEGKGKLVVAGTSSVEKYLPSEFVGRDKGDPEGSRFASMVVQNFIDKFGTEEKRIEVSNTLEYLDYIKNSGYNRGTFLAEQADETYANLKKIRPNVMDKEEMEAYVKAIDYVSGLKTKNVVAESPKNKTGESVEDPKKKIGEKARQSVEDIINEKLEKHPLAFDKSEMPSDSDTEEEREEKLRRRELKIEKRGEGVARVLNQFDMRGRGERSELEIMGPVSVDEIRHTLKEMEDSGRDVSDLTLNSRKFGKLIDITNDINDKIKAIEEGDAEKIEKSIVVLGKNGQVLNKAEMMELRTEIKMRSFLNDFFLATSDAHDIESIAKTMIAFHKGDTDKDWDKMFISFFLKNTEKKDGDGKLKELGSANGLFVDVAWDLRQDAYFNYGGENVNKDVESGILNEIVKREDLMREYARTKGKELDFNSPKDEARTSFLKVSLLMGKSKEYKIDKNYYTNLRNDLNLERKEIVKKYMIEEIVKKVEAKNPDLRGIYTKEEAERAYELARKLSVATYTDSAANIAFADGDDYSELILFKALRYQDGVEVVVEVDDKGVKHRKPAKNKPVGSTETIKYIESLTSPWLATFAKVDADRGAWKVLRAEDIDINKINPKSESTYHFGSIILKKVQEAKLILMSGASAKDVMDPDKTQKVFERLSKVVAEADKAGWNVFNPEYFKLPPVDKDHDRLIEDLVRAQRFMRFVYVMGLLERATKTSLYGWTRTTYDEYVKLLMDSGMFTDVNGGQNEKFISEKQLDWINGAYRPRQIFDLFESRERAKKRKYFR
ncbi:MAG: hypothetical protein US68_C0004G0022 [Candidatus Shapirobacteria bacterium GW2011_GWE1_38_10]|uniref:Uncharacterized protein n=1 Tax=Candidatus Shapirobacteria bacterium GW2011_GWE1_38_10 TaxID=1618488 RepID=A0A0G0IHN8_9BACT|nr:MAG: hypothetical protein US46_C0005G0038 [Candidatus Shapirobacteria bacterium GW2011_GWF2_37_20]KKQ50540.1 MAG: hypothetical protein US68_C0004G0022 [Candidatus Shapirobacteria bacterium GW2011_GWE1_38_10]KKQ64681.1 MAG: hypothetical protein US85_C0005G0029 [Candidatus Shapirobacteria bacterium GW2011_GWF1_38_23]